MKNPITVLAKIKLAKGCTEKDLLAASDTFQKEFVAHEKGVLRRELVKKSDDEYLDIILFRSQKDFEEVMEREQNSEVCHQFFSVMDMDAMDESEAVEIYQSIAIY
ncbi:MAG: hypothetical protein OEX00_00320 [Gammaproteobacteria bacterium]|nr:hypothetical protein [Gammaproteobacteria bacterium]MDH5692441.1 hypothetical protein [Gammaproteobacteria bacterium]